MNPDSIILFDGVCNLCNGAVQFVIRHDPNARFHFAPLQSELAQQLLAKWQHNIPTYSSIVLIADEKIYIKSTAVLTICGQLSGGWKMARTLLIIPRFIRDGVYNFIARNRYRWFGKKKECMIPTPELKQRFLA